MNLASRPGLTSSDHCIALMTVNPELRDLFRAASLAIHDRGPIWNYPLAYFKRAFGPTDVAWLVKVISEEGASVIHAHTFGSHILAVRAARKTNTPVVRTEHGVGHFRDPTRSLFRHWSLLNTDRILAVSEFVGAFVARLEPRAKSKISVIQNGIDTAHFAPAPPPTNGPFTLSMTARLESVKKMHLAIEAVARVAGVRLNIAGTGSLRSPLEALVRKLGLESRVHFHGYQADIRPVIAASDAVMNCTREEGLPLAVIEAAAMQRPAIAFAGGGIPEVVRHGHTGWLTQECTVDAFAALIAEASADRTRAARLGKNARAWVSARFGIEDMCRRYGEMYAEVSERREREEAARATEVDAAG